MDIAIPVLQLHRDRKSLCMTRTLGKYSEYKNNNNNNLL